MQIQIARDGEALVPSLPEEIVPSLLQSKAVLPSDHYWHEGMTEWIPIDVTWPATKWNSNPPTAPGSASGFGSGSAAGFPNLSSASAAT
ncbi:MAG TPA: hypothetical protein VM029_13980 [Opitutaceae bacterium]|nr:hypothetical protein [Opitutaceae bacterium]